MAIYRIERRPAGVLHFYRNEDLVDIDRERGSDSRTDIERWGAMVAWDADHTVVERWEPDVPGDGWRSLIAVPYRYVTWRFDDEDVTAWDELDSANWATRHIEATDRGKVYTAAASLAEVNARRDGGGIDAVRAYEMIYGVVPEAAIPSDAEPHLTPISATEFVERWSAARRHLETRLSSDGTN